MNTIKLSSLLKTTFTWVAALFLISIFATSCSTQKISFANSQVVPAAKGKVKIKTDKNNNHTISISISHLAKPSQLQPARKTYVVWMNTSDNGIKNIGQINTSTGFLSGKLKSSFNTVSSFKPVKIFITAEDDAQIQYPNSQVIMTTPNF